jgi:dTMP kinase
VTKGRGKFITLEGGEGVGKTTNLAFIRAFLERYHIPVLVTREPGGTKLAEKIRGLLLDIESEPVSEQAELLLIFAARAQHIQQVIEPALAAGQWVLCDRFTDATYAYQGGGRHLPVDEIAWLEEKVQGKLRPDLTLLFDAPVMIGMMRAGKRGAFDRFETEKLHFFEEVRQAYLQRAERFQQRIKLIQADRPLQEVQSSLIEILNDVVRDSSVVLDAGLV